MNQRFGVFAFLFVVLVVGGIGSYYRLTPPTRVKRLALWLLDSDTKVRQAAKESVLRMGKKAVPALIKATSHKNEKVRRASIQALGILGPQAVASVPSLQKTLKDKQWRVRRDAVQALGKIGPAASSAVKDVTRLLGDPEWLVRSEAAWTLGRFGEKAKDAVPVLSKTLSDRDWGVRRVAAESLGRLGALAKDAVPALIGALTDRRGSVRRTAVRSLRLIGSAATPAAPFLRRMLSDPEATVRVAAVRALGSFASFHEENATAVLSALLDKNANVQKVALRELYRLGTETISLGLNAEETSVRWAALRLLTRLGERAAPTVPAIAQILFTQRQAGNAQASARLASAAVAALRAASSQTVILLKRQLHTGTISERKIAAFVLGEIGDLGALALPLLERALFDPSTEVRWVAARALSKIKKPVETLREFLESKQPGLRRLGAVALGDLGVRANKALVELNKALIDKDLAVRGAALDALGKIGTTAIPILRRALQSKEVALQIAVARTLGKMGTGAREAVQALLPHLTSDDKALRKAVLFALGQSETNDPRVANAVVERLKDKELSVVLQAVKALQNLGESAQKDGVKVLLARLRDKDDAVVLRATLALGTLGKAARAATAGLLQKLKKADSKLREAIVWTLGQGLDKRAVSALGMLLTEDDKAVRVAAAKALTRFGSQLSGAQEGLKKALSHADVKVREKAIVFIARLGDEGHLFVPQLLKRLRDGDSSIRRMAIERLSVLKGKDPNVLRALLPSLGEPRTMRAAANALVKAGPVAVPFLQKALRSRSRWVRWSAIELLGELGEASAAAVPSLFVLGDAKPAWMAATVRKALQRIGKGALPFLRGVLEQGASTEKTLRALRVVRSIGADAASLVPALKGLATSKKVSKKIIKLASEILVLLDTSGDAKKEPVKGKTAPTSKPSSRPVQKK